MDSGTLQRLRRGWYATPTADTRVSRAVRAGGVLSCASALAFHGAWDVTSGTIHVRTDHHVTRALPTGFRRCLPLVDLPAPTGAVDDLEVALGCAARCLCAEDFVVVVDSLVDRRLMDLEQVSHIMRNRPGIQQVLARCDRAESGTETMVRLRLRSLGVRVTPQVPIAGIGRVDLMIGDRLVIEVDSREHHTGEANYRSDRARDLALLARGYVVIRLTYEQVVHDWPATERHLRRIIRTFGRSGHR